MKKVNLTCKKCEGKFHYNNYWNWVWKSPFHWLWWDKDSKRICDYRYTKCPYCHQKSYMKREK